MIDPAAPKPPPTSQTRGLGAALAQCLLLVAPGYAAPARLAASFERRGVRVVTEHEPLLALAELGRCLINRSREAHAHSSFHHRVRASQESVATPLIIFIVEPSHWSDLDDLLGCLARHMPGVSVAVFSAGSVPQLRLLQRARKAEASAGIDDEDQPIQPPRQTLRLVSADESAGVMKSENQAESLITEEEMAMLLGEAEEYEPPSQRESAT